MEFLVYFPRVEFFRETDRLSVDESSCVEVENSDETRPAASNLRDHLFVLFVKSSTVKDEVV